MGVVGVGVFGVGRVGVFGVGSVTTFRPICRLQIIRGGFAGIQEPHHRELHVCVVMRSRVRRSIRINLRGLCV